MHVISLLALLGLLLHRAGAFCVMLVSPMVRNGHHVVRLGALPTTEVVETIFAKAAARALDGGAAGASAAAVQVLALMWLRTALNYQYRFGTSTGQALRTLWQEGGIARLYQGLPFALLQGPLSRFGDTASNALMLSLVDSLDPIQAVPLFVKTGLGSVAAGIWRIVLMPIDTAKTSLQVNGPKGLEIVGQRVQQEGPSALFSGAVAASAATVVGHYPWFLTYNTLSSSLPTAEQIGQIAAAATAAAASSSQFAAATATAVGAGAGAGAVAVAGAAGALASTDPSDPSALVTAIAALHLDPTLLTLCRSAFIGLCASSASDVCSNSLRVLKTTRQTDSVGNSQSYLDSARGIIDKEGWGGLLGRGLQTRLLANALQGTLFSVLFKYFQAAPK